MASSVNDGSIPGSSNFTETHSSNPDKVEKRIKKLEDSMMLVLAQVQIMHEWIEKHFDVSLINKRAPIMSTCSEQLRQMKKVLDLLKPHPNMHGSDDASTDKELSPSPKKAKPKSTRTRKGKTHPKRISSAGRVEAVNDQEHELQRTSIADDALELDSMSVDSSTSEKFQENQNVSHKKSKDKQVWNSSLPKQCDECGKILKGSSTLKLHKMMHADERPHNCQVCGNRFRFKRNLKVHMMAIHTGERPLQCSYCGRKFYAPKDLKIHERTHTGEKPHACPICPKTFNVKEHLTMHIRVHTGEKPYQCDICDKTFSQANSLRIHKKIHIRDGSGGRSKGRGPSSNANNNSLKKNTGTVGIETRDAESSPSAKLATKSDDGPISSTPYPTSASSHPALPASIQNPTQAISSPSVLSKTPGFPSPYIDPAPVGYSPGSSSWSSGRNPASNQENFYPAPLPANSTTPQQWRMSAMTLPVVTKGNNFCPNYYPPQAQ